ncbi:MAG: delta-60 repeat domain-containing protein [Bacteroidetes bacterium]|nr:delta-60 repeat domain-containing protein [Bacteroidota bacterium]
MEIASGIIRLNDSGSIDTTFNSIKLDSTSREPYVFDLKIQLDGKVLAGGHFTYKNSSGNTVYNLIRVDSNGALDSSFDIGPGTGQVNSILIQPDQKILVAGGFHQWVNSNSQRNVSYSSDGTLDTSFSVNGVGINYGSQIYKIKTQTDGSIIAIGIFSSFNQIPSPGIVKILNNGVHDTTYNIGTGFNNHPEDLSIQNDDKTLVLGAFLVTKIMGL